MVKIASYGAWTSPISAQDVARAVGAPEWVDLHDGQVWWAQSRPEEGGRIALMRDVDGVAEEVLPGDWNVRNRVHEYGGRPWVALATPQGTRVAFTNWADQRIYLADPNARSEPTPIAPDPQRRHGVRYSDLTAAPGGEHVWCVRETVTGDRPTDIEHHLVAVPLDGSTPTVLAASHHFMTAPKASPDGRHVVWIGWDHPQMPWDGNELCLAEVRDDGTFGEHRVIGGGPREAVCQVEWDGDDALLALTDPQGWWNLHRIGLDGTATNLAPGEFEIGGPMWLLGWRWFTPLGGGRHAVLRSGRLAVLDERSGTVTDVETDYQVWSPTLAASDGVVVCTAAGPTRDMAVVSLDLSTGEVTELTPSRPADVDERYLPIPKAREFVGPDGRAIPTYVYAPGSPDFAAPEGELAPYLVHVHGGPTGSFSPVLLRSFAYLTSRGIGIVAVNHGGSTGYGREFRELLTEQWGVVDVADCAVVATELAKEGTADAARLGIRGGSAGGWTSAVAISTTDTYACAALTCPVLDLTSWTGPQGQTHDFESRYVDGLIGALPEHAQRYVERSPISHLDTLRGPVLLMQGLEDEVCPAEQANRFIAGLDGTGVPHAYLAFEGEQHGFRKAETMEAVTEAELSFYGQVFGFTPEGVPTLRLHT